MALSLGLGIGITPGKGGGFDLSSYLASLPRSLLYRGDQADGMFTTPTGPTQVTAGAGVGLLLDRARWGGRSLEAYLAGQAQLATVSSQAAVPSGGLAFTNYPISSPLVIGRCYEIRFTVTGYAGSGSVGIAGGADKYEPDVLNGERSGNGTVTVFATAQTAAGVELFSRSTNTCTFTDISVKEVSRAAATQATGGFQPSFQTDFIRGDGVDDLLAAPYLPGTEDFIVVRARFPAASLGTRIVAGNAIGATSRFYLSMVSTGRISGSIGSLSPVTFFDPSGIDRRGQIIPIGISHGGGMARLFVGEGQVAEAAYTGDAAPTHPLHLLAARTNTGTGTAFSDADVYGAAIGGAFLDLSTYRQIASQL